MKKRWISLLAALAVAAGVCRAVPMMSQAAPLDTQYEDCKLTVYPEDPDKEDSFGEDLEAADVVLDLYRVADLKKTPGYESYTCEFLPPYQGLSISSKPNAGEWKSLAQQAAKTAFSSGVKAAEAQESGSVIQERITPGLYLLIARGSALTDAEDYQMIMETEEGEEALYTIADSAQYTYRFSPQLIALPMRGDGDTLEIKEGNIYMTSDRDDWVYDLKVYLKPQREQRYGSLKIVKTLMQFEEEEGVPEPATFVFRVEWELAGEEGEKPQSGVRYESMTFTEAGEDYVIVSRLPAAATVTVTEVYSGSSYTVDGAAVGEQVITADRIVNGEPDEGQMAAVDFRNRYDNRGQKGWGIRNRFTFDGEKWNWIPDSGTTGGQEDEE